MSVHCLSQGPYRYMSEAHQGARMTPTCPGPRPAPLFWVHEIGTISLLKSVTLWLLYLLTCYFTGGLGSVPNLRRKRDLTKQLPRSSIHTAPILEELSAETYLCPFSCIITIMRPRILQGISGRSVLSNSLLHDTALTPRKCHSRLPSRRTFPPVHSKA